MQHQRFENSFKRIFGEQVGITEAGESFFVRFYEIFLASSPVVRELFTRTDMTHQVTMLRRSLYELVTFYVSGVLSEPLRRIAQVHQHLAITPDLYDVWLDALIATVREFDSECDELTEYAWRLALTPGISYMKLWCGSSQNPYDGP
jgi:hemoglobin-like flavoprotein